MEDGREEDVRDSLTENDDSYIEIELDSCAVVVPTSTCGSSEEEDDKIMKEYDELRISISSSIPLPYVHQCVVDVDSSEEHGETRVDPSASASASGPPSLTASADSVTQSVDDDQRRVKFGVAFDRRSNFKVDFWEKRSSDHASITLQTSATMPFDSSNNIDQRSAHTRKEGSMTRRRNCGIIMKILIKFRGIRLPTLISSLVKPPRPPCQDTIISKGNSRKYYRNNILPCYHHHHHHQKKSKNMVINNNPSSSQEEEATGRNAGSFRSNTSRRSSWNRSVVEIDLSALKGMFSSIGTNKRKSCSTVSSCHNSPIHEGFSFTCSSSDNSIQAAIAYCKTSFGQTSDFSF